MLLYFHQSKKKSSFLSGSSLLPPHLDFFNFSRRGQSQEQSQSQNADPSHVVGKDPGVTRESTPESSSVSSNMNDEAYDTRTPSPVSRTVCVELI